MEVRGLFSAHLLFFVAYFPVDQEGQQASQHDDRAKYAEFRPFAHDDGAEHLTAHLELQGERNPLCQIEPYVSIAFAYPVQEAFQGSKDQDADTEKLHQNCAELYDSGEYMFREFDK